MSIESNNPPADPDNLSELLTHATGSWRSAIPIQEALRTKLQRVSSLLIALGRPVEAPSLLTQRSADEPVMIREIEGSLTVGRHESADWSLPDVAKISRIQFRVFHRSGSWWIEDNASKNGTFLEGSTERITLRPLANGDVFHAGGLAFAFVMPE
jgi:pSer/pThr/pTyr-binding forkhead associated (FHA) protein